MNETAINTAPVSVRYHLLDGMRGVAALVVIFFHFGEAFATSSIDQMMNHGYLAVDFFFVLSGFVIGHAYDNRLKTGKITASGFMLRRVIRLQPMVVLGALLGLSAYIIQGCVKWDGTPMSAGYVTVAFLLTLLVIPAIPGTGADLRGNSEMFPLNGPEWSLFFEYIGSLFYAFVLHRLSDRLLKTVVLLSAIGLAICALSNFSGGYTTGFGWSIAANGGSGFGLLGGFLHMSFSFSLGLLMARGFKPLHVRGSFWIGSVLIVAVCICPYITDNGQFSILNAIYDTSMTIFVLPAIVYLGASGDTTDRFSTRVCNLLGVLSYPIYIVHYPMMYLLYHWVWSNNITPAGAIPACVAILIGSVILAYAAYHLYDKPIRAYLTRKWISSRNKS